jgi:hypothetical protein
MAVEKVLTGDLDQILDEDSHIQVVEVVFILILATEKVDFVVDDGKAVAVPSARHAARLLTLEPPEHFVFARPLLELVNILDYTVFVKFYLTLR